MRPGSLTRCDTVALFEIEVRNHQDAEKDQRVDDEQNAEPGIAPGEVGDAGGDQRDAKSKIREFFDFERDVRYQQRQESQYLGGRELYLEVLR
jgi:hypothetical protein